MISLDYRDGRPLYQQVKDDLRRKILTGLLPPDEKLPSVRSLATQLAINPNTIQRAYSELEAEGYLLRGGKGQLCRCRRRAAAAHPRADGQAGPCAGGAEDAGLHAGGAFAAVGRRNAPCLKQKTW